MLMPVGAPPIVGIADSGAGELLVVGIQLPRLFELLEALQKVAVGTENLEFSSQEGLPNGLIPFSVKLVSLPPLPTSLPRAAEDFVFETIIVHVVELQDPRVAKSTTCAVWPKLSDERVAELKMLLPLVRAEVPRIVFAPLASALCGTLSHFRLRRSRYREPSVSRPQGQDSGGLHPLVS